MKKILIGMRGGIGDIVLFTSVLESFRAVYPKNEYHIICGTSRACESLSRSIPFFDDYIIDFRPRYVNQSGTEYKDRRSKIHVPGISRYYCLDHPYRGVDIEVANQNHIIDLAAKTLGITKFNRKGKVFLGIDNIKYADSLLSTLPKPLVLISPLTSQNKKIPSLGLMSCIVSKFYNAGYNPVCLVSTPKMDIPEIPCQKLYISSILNVAALISKANYYVGLDSGLSHIASSFDVPMSTLHIGYSPNRSGVLSESANIMYFKHRAIRYELWDEIADKIIADRSKSA